MKLNRIQLQSVIQRVSKNYAFLKINEDGREGYAPVVIDFAELNLLDMCLLFCNGFRKKFLTQKVKDTNFLVSLENIFTDDEKYFLFVKNRVWYIIERQGTVFYGMKIYFRLFETVDELELTARLNK